MSLCATGWLLAIYGALEGDFEEASDSRWMKELLEDLNPNRWGLKRQKGVPSSDQSIKARENGSTGRLATFCHCAIECLECQLGSRKRKKEKRQFRAKLQIRMQDDKT